MVVLFLAGATLARNHAWRSWESLWQDVKTKSPRKARPYNNLGVYYGRQGETDKAIREFESALMLNPRYLEAIDNLGFSYKKAGRMGDALNMLRALDPETYSSLLIYQENKSSRMSVGH